MTIATHEAQRDAVEQWARVRGFWMRTTGHDAAWCVARTGDPGDDRTRISCSGMPTDGWLEPAVALAWALLVEVGGDLTARMFVDAVTFGVSERGALAVLADRLLAAGDPVGLALAWGLRWSDGEGTEDGTGEAVMLLHWLTVARGQAALANFRRNHGVLMLDLDDWRDPPDTIVLSPEAAARLYSKPLPMPDPEHVSQRGRSGHARHVGDRLGRRLGVRR
jgi:hypothetical protein